MGTLSIHFSVAPSEYNSLKTEQNGTTVGMVGEYSKRKSGFENGPDQN